MNQPDEYIGSPIRRNQDVVDTHIEYLRRFERIEAAAKKGRK